MKKTEIIKKNFEFKRIFSKGKHYGGKYLEVFILKNRKEINGLGVAVSKKVGNSVTRNKIKRLIRENYKIIEEDLFEGFDFIFIWKRGASKDYATFYNVKNDMFEIFNKNNLIRKGIKDENDAD